MRALLRSLLPFLVGLPILALVQAFLPSDYFLIASSRSA